MKCTLGNSRIYQDSDGGVDQLPRVFNTCMAQVEVSEDRMYNALMARTKKNVRIP